MNNLAEVLHKAENVNLKVGAVNAIESGEASARYSIKHFPTFHLVSSKGVGNMGHEEYQGARTVGAFLQYLKGKYPIFVDEKGDFVPPRLYSDDHDVLISKIVASDDAKSLNSLIKEIAKARDDPSAIKKGYESYDMLHKLAVKISANPEAEIALETLKDLHEKLQGIINMESGDSVQVNLEGIKHRVHTKFIIGKLISSYQKKLSEGDATATKGSVLEDLGSEDI